MFRPLAWTKTLAVGFSSVLAISLVPVLMILFIRGKLRPESKNPISRITQAIYLPVLRLCLRYRKTTLLLNLLFLILTLPLALKIGSQFMPPLFEGSALYMPTALPGISITQASQLLREQDRIEAGQEFEVERVERGEYLLVRVIPVEPRRLIGGDVDDVGEALAQRD